jgi:6-carboxyhexanoate--CoA ligase
MTQDKLYNIRMRASWGGAHVSGAERIVPASGIDGTVTELINRAKEKKKVPDRITINIEDLDRSTLRFLTALDIVTINASDPETGRSSATRLLQGAGISSKAVETAFTALSIGAAPSGGNMRGAMIMDMRTGERLEPDQERGVRASRFDWSEEARRGIDRILVESGLTHFRVREALALSTKVVHGPGVIAELCWSDDPDYTAGYIASLKTGYVRFPFLKNCGDNKGGRVIFVDQNDLDLAALVNYLQKEIVLINAPGKYPAPMRRFGSPVTT